MDVCFWQKDNCDGYYVTSCNHRFSFTDGGSRENGFRYCPYCGKSAVDATKEPRPDGRPDKDGWIVWVGGLVAPVTGEVEVRWSDGSTDIGSARDWRWGHSNHMINIIAYRVIDNDGMEG